ncbi:phosphatase PAP2 family protein [Paenibacillus sp. PK4536]|jgi:undecaprenyl-diphosphatase|uniref:Undecaprenyl-diphosphate phosphatase n=1 Tax=Paenibacillus nuruki TaxID=1886670 RepID=A0A1E3L4U6_9BACL|nr:MULTISPECIES: phosphatase PAP2 family protein [Paenibacillus]ODP28847.1 Undecaprenyl-diphosphate phosphatase [Paenibacillus nuruki]TKJ92102.1 phosphatase PAP2 family protein [Paenibacillus sp. CFBP13512]WIM37372.1 phosphatase PAP2 family protein [Paenibacillus sp. PK4536]CAJ1316095.1 Undecaprenyl-diphosphate phosphatase [Paenibacillus nuruki]
MRHFLIRLQTMEQHIFRWFNSRLHNKFLNLFFYYLTNLGGATFTIIATLAVWQFAPAPWGRAGLQAAVALAISHVPVAIVKKLYPRIRPYLAIPETITFRNPLTDHSFPSGHTTAIFSVTVPFMLTDPLMILLLLPFALIVAVSRMYLGLHYPSDVLVGAAIGTSVAMGTFALWP